MEGHRGRIAFTLLELLVVIAIVGVLVGLVLAAVQKVRHSALRAACGDHLRQIGLALHHYHDAYGVLPPGVSYRDGSDPYPFLSWSARLLPFLEQESLWMETEKAFAQDPRFLHNPPHVGLSVVMPVYSCPADLRMLTVAPIVPPSGVALTAYLGVEGTNQFRGDGVLYLDSAVRIADITDGASHTLMVGERPPSATLALGWWYAGEGQRKDGSADSVLGVKERNVQSPYGAGCPVGPYTFGPGDVTNKCDAFHFWSLHPGGSHFLFADASVHFVPYSAADTMVALATRAGGEVVNPAD